MFHMCHSNISTLRVALKSAMAAVLVAKTGDFWPEGGTIYSCVLSGTT